LSASDGSELELTPGQSGIWYAQLLRPDSPHFNLGTCVEITGRMDAAVFEAALQRTVGATDAFHLCGSGRAATVHARRWRSRVTGHSRTSTSLPHLIRTRRRAACRCPVEPPNASFLKSCTSFLGGRRVSVVVVVPRSRVWPWR
jgi:hypothetical protein